VVTSARSYSEPTEPASISSWLGMPTAT
jgi:hypothetical protein